MNDTSPAMNKRFHELVMSRTPLDRLKMASRMFDSGRKLAIAGIEDREKGLSDGQIRTRLFIRLYGRDFPPEKLSEIISKLPSMHPDKTM
jgi:hypothetical protein